MAFISSHRWMAKLEYNFFDRPLFPSTVCCHCCALCRFLILQMRSLRLLVNYFFFFLERASFILVKQKYHHVVHVMPFLMNPVWDTVSLVVFHQQGKFYSLLLLYSSFSVCNSKFIMLTPETVLPVFSLFFMISISLCVLFSFSITAYFFHLISQTTHLFLSQDHSFFSVSLMKIVKCYDS